MNKQKIILKNEDLYCYIKNSSVSKKGNYEPLVLDAKCQFGNIEFIFWRPDLLNLNKEDKKTWPVKTGDFIKVSFNNFDSAKKEYENKNNIPLQGNYSSNCAYKVINEEDIPEELLSVIYKNRNPQIEVAKNSLKDDSCWTDKNLGKILRETICEYPSFIKIPAASKNHHVYEGGLLVHSYEVKKISQNIARTLDHLYPDIINLDVLFFSAWIHDIGKTETYFINESGDFDCDFEKEKKLNHIVRGYGIFNHISKKYNMDPEISEKIGHCILCHHDRREWDAPIEPVEIEAIILAKADYLSSQIAKYD